MAGGGAIPTGPVSPRALLEGGTAAGVWALDLGASELAFRVKHFWGAVAVRGHFHTFSGRRLSTRRARSREASTWMQHRSTPRMPCVTRTFGPPTSSTLPTIRRSGTRSVRSACSATTASDDSDVHVVHLVLGANPSPPDLRA
jgi:hypothetical protein